MYDKKYFYGFIVCFIIGTILFIFVSMPIFIKDYNMLQENQIYYFCQAWYKKRFFDLNMFLHDYFNGLFITFYVGGLLFLFFFFDLKIPSIKIKNIKIFINKYKYSRGKS